MRKLIAWFIENHVAANLLMIFVLLAGSLAAINSKVEIFPETTADKVTITVLYPGASPAEVEEGVLKKIEDVVSGLDGVKEINGYASEGSALVEVEAVKGWDIDKLFDDVKSEVNRITTLPENAERPVIKKFVFKAPVLNVAVYGNAPIHVLKDYAERIRDDITALPDVTQAETFGVSNPEIAIEIPERNLKKYGLTLAEVADKVRRWSIDLGGGEVREGAGYILLRAKGRRYIAKEYRDIVILSRPDGTRVRLSDIATIRDTFEEPERVSRFNGLPSVGILVYRIGRENALTVASAVKEYIETLRPVLPPNIHVDTFGDRSEILRARLTLLLKNMAYGMVLVVLVLGSFLNRRLSFWITLGIPIAFAFGLYLLPSYNVSINMISLFAFIMVLGIVVDDAIVVGESIYRKREQGIHAFQAAVEGTMEVAVPVIFAVLTTIAAFWPLLLGTGVMGKVIKNIPVVVIAVLAGSLIEALLILPAHLARSRLPSKRGRKERFISNTLGRFIEGPFKKTLAIALRWRYITIAIGIFILLFSLGLWSGGRIKFTFFPKVESDRMICEVTMPPDTPYSKTRRVIERIEKAATEASEEAEKLRDDRSEPLIRYTYSILGSQVPMGHVSTTGPMPSGSHVGQVIVQLIGSEKRRELSTSMVTNIWRKKVGEIHGAESVRFYSELFSAGKAVSFDLTMHDEVALHRAVEELKRELKKYPGVYDIDDSYIPGKEEIRISLKPSAKTLGITLSELARQVRDAFYGAEALRIQRGMDEVKVLVKYPEEERKRLESLLDMDIRTTDGREIPFLEVATLKRSRSYVTITRRDQKRIVTVSAEVNEDIMNANELRKEMLENVLPRLKEHYPDLIYTLAGEGKEQEESMADVMRGFLLALLLIYTLIAIPLRSFSQPVVIMSAIPFGIIGAIFGHMVMGINLSIMSMFGIVGLSGVVVNDSLILFAEINRLKKGGLDTFDAILRGTGVRFRPVILTTLTTFAGLIPIITERSVQAKFLIPMALTLAFGVLFATLITLILVPCGYRITEDVKALFRR
jgi:multidrug efflux pump subunit AcrB